MKLSEMKNEAALDALCLLIDPVTEICTKEFLDILQTGKVMAAAKHVLKNHKKALIQIFAIMDGEDPETYSVNMLQIVSKTVALLTDRELTEVFTSVPQSVGEVSSGAASVGGTVEQA